MTKDWTTHISGYLDGELGPAQREAFEAQLARDEELAREFEQLRALREVTADMKLKDFPDEVWDKYWEGTYHRMERRVGWILLSVGFMVLFAAGLYELVMQLFQDSHEPWWIRAAIGAFCGGLAVLFVSVVRERLFTLKKDPYREIKR